MCAIFHELAHSVANDTEGLLLNANSEVPTSERPVLTDWHARGKLLLKRSPFVICSVLVLIFGVICAARLEYKSSHKEYSSSAFCNNSAVVF